MFSILTKLRDKNRRESLGGLVDACRGGSVCRYSVNLGSNRSLSELVMKTRMDIWTEIPNLFYVEMQEGGQWRASWDNCS